jgi:hypothetical protein
VLDENDRTRAHELLAATAPEINRAEPKVEFFEGLRNNATVS